MALIFDARDRAGACRSQLCQQRPIREEELAIARFAGVEAWPLCAFGNLASTLSSFVVIT